MARCMGDPTVKTDFDKQPQRIAFCLNRWREAHGKPIETKLDQHVFAAEMMKLGQNYICLWSKEDVDGWSP